jgi:cytochrome c peroxidase
VNNQALMTSSFKAAMEKLAIVGHSASSMIDCSEAVPAALPPVNKPATFPAGKTHADIEQACATAPFPTLATDRKYFSLFTMDIDLLYIPF